ncbi:hypothetical protein BGZ76_007875 [Entomortierella beljakovae]|nr:hypothetical protein BGZ76_007875 [Entomortierella beljakovae]
MTSTKKKSLTIHIETDNIGPHGMPLIYGSTSENVGSIKGSVHFSSNYDCKGRDIQIIYEAWIETHGSVLPSSSYSVKTRIRYTIRAVLQRPFPSLSNFESSQEIWVVNSKTPHFPASPIHITAGIPSYPVPNGSVELPEESPKCEVVLESPAPLPELKGYASATKNTWSPMKSDSFIVEPINQVGNKQQYIVCLFYVCTLVLSFGLCKRLSSI